MKIMKVVDKKVGDITYIKYRINLPKKVVEDSGLKDSEVKVSLDGEKIIIETNNQNEIKLKLTNKEKMLQKEFMKLIQNR